MGDEELLALREGDRMRFNDGELVKGRSRDGDQVVHDRYHHFRQYIQIAFHQQIEGSVDRTRETIFDRREQIVGHAVANGAESGLKSRAPYELDILAQELHGSLFTEGAAFALKCDARVFRNLHFLARVDFFGAAVKAELRPSCAPKPYCCCVRIDSSRIT